MKVEIPDEVIRDLQRLDALQSCRVKFSSIPEREKQMENCDRLRSHISDIVLSIVMAEIIA